MCRKIFKEDKTKSFYLLADYDNQIADLALSLDVIFHLIEDNIIMRSIWKDCLMYQRDM